MAADAAPTTQSVLTRLAPTEVELEIPLLPDEVAAAEQRAFSRLARKVKMPGFRPGHVPRHLFEQTYGKDVIETEAFENLAPVAYERAVREHGIDPLGTPEFALLPGEDSKPHRLKASVEVRPDIELGEYKGVSVSVPPEPVTDEEVRRSLDALARERATLVPVNRAARSGDVVTIDYEGKIGGEPLEGANATGYQLELIEQRFIPGFVDNVTGMTSGESKTFDVAFPPDYVRAEYAGKAASFSVTMHDVKELELPALDDAFAKSVSDYETLEELRAVIRTRLEAVATARRRRAIANAVVERLLERTDVPVPERLLDREVQAAIAEDGASEQPDAEARERLRREAVSRVRGTLLIEAIAKTEGIEASAEELNVEIASLARRYGQTPERMRKALRGRLESLRAGIVRSKTLDLLVDSARADEPR